MRKRPERDERDGLFISVAGQSGMGQYTATTLHYSLLTHLTRLPATTYPCTTRNHPRGSAVQDDSQWHIHTVQSTINTVLVLDGITTQTHQDLT